MPPCAPSARMWADCVCSTLPLALTWMLPPGLAELALLPKALASHKPASSMLRVCTSIVGARKVPVCTTAWLASSRTTPFTWFSWVASIVPVLLITPPCTLARALADRMTTPPGASTTCRFSTRACHAPPSTTTPWSWSLALRRKVTASPAARATVPLLATITPLLRTSGASKAT